MNLEEALNRCRPTERGTVSAEAETSFGVYIADQRGDTTLFHLDDGKSLIRVDLHWLPKNLSWKPVRPIERKSDGS